ncbi:MAG: pyridoxal-dependent decarboxylase [Gammaproteobacteria bacterium]
MDSERVDSEGEDLEPGRHMTPEEFRRHGHAVIDWIADYYRHIEEYPVMSQLRPGELCKGLPAHPPARGEPFDRVLADLTRVILPGITHWQSPSFFAYFPANTSGPSILGELLAAGLGVQGMMWVTSPACTELETRVLDWLVEMLDLPLAFRSDRAGGGVIQDSASSATLCALLAARERTTQGQGNRLGCDRRLVVYASREAHASVEKAVRIAGLGSDMLRRVAVDERYAMCPDRLAAQIAEDSRHGLRPCMVVATLGTTSSNAFDPLTAIGPLCRHEGVWLHVDAAMCGSAALCPEYRHLQAGLEYADSYCFNPHKWLLTNFDCDCFYTADRASLIRALSIQPEYLQNPASASGAAIDYRDWQVPLGRRFRALKLWMVIRHYGIEGLRRHIRRHVSLAHELAGWIERSPAFELVIAPVLNLVCFRHHGGDEFNRRLLERLNRSGRLFLSHTRLGERYVLRLCVGQTHTELRHVRDGWAFIQATAAAMAAAGADGL